MKGALKTKCTRLFAAMLVILGTAMHTPNSRAASPAIPTSERSIAAREQWLGSPSRPGPLTQELKTAGFKPGDSVFFRIFKQLDEPEEDLHPQGKGVLEVWLEQPSGRYALFKTFPIEKFSGLLGPKLREGDRQAPEGFYAIKPELMNPNSQYHLAMNVGYPNAYDRSLNRTGSFIMIHGDKVSVGCFAMNDTVIEQLYVLAEAALLRGQDEIPVHVFPFPMNHDHMEEAEETEWHDFWLNLSEGYEWFERYGVPPFVDTQNGRYIFRAG